MLVPTALWAHTAFDLAAWGAGIGHSRAAAAVKLAAVMVPSRRKAGLRLGIFSGESLSFQSLEELQGPSRITSRSPAVATPAGTASASDVTSARGVMRGIPASSGASVSLSENSQFIGGTNYAGEIKR